MRVHVIVLALLLVGFVPMVPASGSCSGNDCFADAAPHFGRTLSGSNFAASMEPGEPTACDMTKSVWFTATPRSNGTLTLALSGEWLSALGVHHGASVDALASVGCSETWYDPEGTPDDSWFPASMSVACVADVPLRIQVGGQSNATGSFTLALYGCAFDATLPDAPVWCTGPVAPCPAGGDRKVTMGWYPPFWDGGELTSITHYNVYRAPGSCAAAFAFLATAPAERYPDHEDAGLAPGSVFCYKVAAVNGVGEGPSTPARLATVWDYARPPTAVGAAQTAYRAILVSWGASPDASPPVLGYRIYTAASAAGPFELLGDLSPGARQYADGSVEAFETRCYLLATLNAVGEGAQSPASCARVIPPPTAPQGLSMRHTLAVPPIAYELRWSPPEYAEGLRGYHVWEVSPSDGGLTLRGTTSPDVARFVVTGRLPVARYEYVVTAFNVAGDGDASGSACMAYPMELVGFEC